MTTMELKVAVFEDLKVTTKGDIIKLRPDYYYAYIRDGFVVSNERKFIVMKCEHSILLAIGPVLTSPSYYHRDIRNVASGECCGKMAISGGGHVEFKSSTCRKGRGFARFHGLSGDFGVYDPLILQEWNRSAIERALNMGVLFEWSV